MNRGGGFGRQGAKRFRSYVTARQLAYLRQHYGPSHWRVAFEEARIPPDERKRRPSSPERPTRVDRNRAKRLRRAQGGR